MKLVEFISILNSCLLVGSPAQVSPQSGSALAGSALAVSLAQKGPQAGRSFAWMAFQDGDEPWRVLNSARTTWNLPVQDPKGRYALAWVEVPEPAVNLLFSDCTADPRLVLHSSRGASCPWDAPPPRPAGDARQRDSEVSPSTAGEIMVWDPTLRAWASTTGRGGDRGGPGEPSGAGTSSARAEGMALEPLREATFQFEARDERLKVGVRIPLTNGWDGFQAQLGQPGSATWSLSIRNTTREGLAVAVPDFAELQGWNAAWTLRAATDLWAVLRALRSSGPWSSGFGQWEAREGQVLCRSEVLWQWAPTGRPAPPPYPGYPRPRAAVDDVFAFTPDPVVR